MASNPISLATDREMVAQVEVRAATEGVGPCRLRSGRTDKSEMEAKSAKRYHIEKAECY